MKTLWLVLLLAVCLPSFGQRFMEEVPTIAALKTRLPGGINKSVFVRGYYSEGDGGGGTFIITNSIVGVDNGLRIQSTAGGTFSYVRQFSGPVNPKWFGCKGDGITDDSLRLQEAVSSGYAVLLPSATTFRTTVVINIPSNARISGGGSSSIIYSTSVIGLNLGNVTNVTLSNWHLDGTSVVGLQIAFGGGHTLDHFEQSGATIAGAFTAGISIDSSANVKLLYPYLHNNGVNSTNLGADYNIIANVSNIPSSGLLIQSPRIINGNSKYGIGFFCQSDARVIDPYIDMKGKGGPQNNNGYGIFSYGNVGNSNRRISIIGGTITNTYGSGIYVNNTVDAEIIGVHLDKTSQVQSDGTLSASGIGVSSSSNIRVVDNSITNSGISAGITFDQTTNCVASGNNVYLSGTNRPAIYLRGYNYGPSINGNTVWNATWGIGNGLAGGDVVDGGDIEGNVIRNTVYGIILAAGSSNTVVRANRLQNNTNAILDLGSNNTLSHNILVSGVNGLLLQGTNGIVQGNLAVLFGTGASVSGGGYKFDEFNRLENNTLAISDSAGALVKTLISGQYPSVKDTRAYYLSYAAPTVITNFADALPGAIRRFTALNSNATVAYSTSVILDGAGDFNLKTGDTLELLLDAAGVWHQTGKSINNNWLWYDRANERIVLNGVSYVLPSVQGPAGGLWANDGTGAISWQLPTNIFHFGPQFYITSNTNIDLAPITFLNYNFDPNSFTVINASNVFLNVGTTVTNVVLAQNTTTPMVDVGASSGSFNVDASKSMEFSIRLTGNATITFTNWTDWHPLNVTVTNTGNFSLSFANTMFWVPNQNSTQVTNDWGVGAINVFHFYMATGQNIIASNPERAAGGLSGGSGANGQVAYWSGPTTVTGDTNFLWSAAARSLTLLNGILLLGTATNQLTVSGSDLVYTNVGNVKFKVKNANGESYIDNDPTGQSAHFQGGTLSAYFANGNGRGVVATDTVLAPTVNNTIDLGSSGSLRWKNLALDGYVIWNAATNSLRDSWGGGSPEGVVTASPGSIYRDGTAGVIYKKASGVGTTGWIDLSGPGGGATNAYNLVKDEGVSVTARTTLNFAGAGVTATDSGGQTLVTIPGGTVVNGGTGSDLSGSLSGAIPFYDTASGTFVTTVTAYTNALIYSQSAGLLEIYRTNINGNPLLTMVEGGGGSVPLIFGYADKFVAANTNLTLETGLNWKVRTRINGVSVQEVGTFLQTMRGRVINRFATATNYTLSATNHYVAATATCTNSLPAASTVTSGQLVIIKNLAGTTTVRPNGTDTIDGVAADDVLTAKASHTYISDGVSNWELN